MDGNLDQWSPPFPADGTDRKARILLYCRDTAAVASVLAGSGYDVHSVSSPADGISELKNNAFAAVVADAGMSPVDGIAFRRMVREHHARIPVLIRVNRTDDSDETLLNAVAEDPYSSMIPQKAPPDLLLNEIGHVLSAYQAESQWAGEQRELELKQDLAYDLQKAMLPPMLFSGAVFEYGFIYLPHRSAGGDLFERISVSENECVFVFGKLSGRGIQAALSTIAVQSFLKNIPSAVLDQPYRIADALNRFLRRSLRGLVYMCTLVVYFDFRKNVIRSFNAGYSDLFCFDAATGKFKDLNPERKCGVPAGLMKNAEFCEKDQCEAVFEDQDVFAFGSEGFFNLSVDPENTECLEVPFFRDLLSQTAGRAIRYGSLITTPYILYDFLEKFGYTCRQDDVTLFILRKRPAKTPPPIYFNLIRFFDSAILGELEKIAAETAKHFHDKTFVENIKSFLHRYLVSLAEVVRKSRRGDTEYVVLKLSVSNGMLDVVSWDRGQTSEVKDAMPSGGAHVRICDLHLYTYSGINERRFSISANPEAGS